MTKRKTTDIKDQLTIIKDNLRSVFHKQTKEDKAQSAEKSAGDMDEAHSPVADERRLEFEGLTREKAKAALAKTIEEKLERVSKIEISQIEIDAGERAQQKFLAAERVEQRRKKRKEKQMVEIEPEQLVVAKEPEQLVVAQDPEVDMAMDSAIDKVFDFFVKGKQKGIMACARVYVFVLKIGREGKARIQSGKAVLWLGDRINFQLIPILTNGKEKLMPFMQRISKTEKKLSYAMGGFINWLDEKNDKVFQLTSRGVFLVGNKFYELRETAERNKKKILIGFGAGVAVAAGVMLTIGSMTAYEYIYNGKVLGVVKYQEDVYKTIDVVGDKLRHTYNAEVSIDKEKDITFKKVYALNQELDDKEDILNSLTYMKDMKARGYGIFVNNGLKAILESKESANEILQEIKNTYVKDSDSIDYVEVGFAENVTIEEVDTRLGNIKRKEEVIEYMLTGAEEKQVHQVDSGETFSGIAKAYGIKQSELAASNPDVIPEKLSIGQEISLTKVVPVATVQTVEVATTTEKVPFEISYEDTGSMYKGETTVKSKGTNGQREVVAEIVRNNGIEVERKEIKSTILSEPVSQVVLVGTKELPPLIGTGKFVYPTRGRLSSSYGTRWGRLHAGIDLAASTGTKIVAADGGKVVFSGYNGSLGYMVKIDHGGGRVTLYAHCSKLHVKAGQRVYQGQHIANVGNTGRSTGPHLHFEVHINGKTKNPLNYL